MKQADSERLLAWMRQQILAFLKKSRQGERQKSIIDQLLRESNQPRLWRRAPSTKQFRRLVVQATRALVNEGTVAFVEIDRSHLPAKDHNGRPCSMPPLRVYRCRGLLEQLAWAALDPEERARILTP